ncbi:hypothetical protein SARC_03972 [Sphaeroforma arctica JP610]|uniref:Helicase/UvrB N-terminal domain-containing protein n=1 Tax=Sphaeroforma arctica JP610 TaxID=667725 RepID=A0A0L0G4R8_9EUKA|nr:hypothetical protein SARC_03972 [Sphaeroforma arctica JP610]KNC83796.1 hypothetical protein SARC_03972 [Sphaeroforma arctica JP610]|eukprot:XP_014157698.1 hypothetical protein SARC_03972 [Sphaeroforma arctica JP610]
MLIATQPVMPVDNTPITLAPRPNLTRTPAPSHQPTPHGHGLRAPTAEQQMAIDAVARGDKVTLMACAGAGKTFTMLAIVDRLSREAIGKRILILAYSSWLKTDTRKRAAAACGGRPYLPLAVFGCH